MKASVAIALGASGVGRRAIEQAARHEEYFVFARACGVEDEQAKAILEEEMLKPVNYWDDDHVQHAKWRIASGHLTS